MTLDSFFRGFLLGLMMLDLLLTGMNWYIGHPGHACIFSFSLCLLTWVYRSRY